MSGELRVAREVPGQAEVVGVRRGTANAAWPCRARPCTMTSPCRSRRTWDVVGALRPGLVGVHSTNGLYWRAQEIMGERFGKVARSGEAERERGASRWNVAGMAMARLGLVVSKWFSCMG